MTKILQIIPPAGWRIGQTLFNFLEWLHREKGFEGGSEIGRMADPFHIPDELIVNYYQEFLKTLK